MRRSRRLGLPLLLAVVAVAGLVVPAYFAMGQAASPAHPASGPTALAGISGDSSTVVSCPAGSSLTWGSITLNCFQTLDLAEIGAILIGVGIAIYIYWDSDEAELPGDSAEVPVTAEEEIEVARQRKEARSP